MCLCAIVNEERLSAKVLLKGGRGVSLSVRSRAPSIRVVALGGRELRKVVLLSYGPIMALMEIHESLSWQ